MSQSASEFGRLGTYAFDLISNCSRHGSPKIVPTHSDPRQAFNIQLKILKLSTNSGSTMTRSLIRSNRALPNIIGLDRGQNLTQRIVTRLCLSQVSLQSYIQLVLKIFSKYFPIISQTIIPKNTIVPFVDGALCTVTKFILIVVEDTRQSGASFFVHQQDKP